MAWIIIPKNSASAGVVPTTADLADGEIGFNSADRKIYQRVGSNIVDYMARPYARVVMSAAYTVPATGVRVLPFDTAVRDDSLMLDPVNYRIVPTIPGLYQVVLCAYSTGTPTGSTLSYHQVAARKNGDITLHGVSSIPSASGVNLVGLTHAAVMEMNGSTDYIDGTVRASIGISVSTTFTVLTVARIG